MCVPGGPQGKSLHTFLDVTVLWVSSASQNLPWIIIISFIRLMWHLKLPADEFACHAADQALYSNIDSTFSSITGSALGVAAVLNYEAASTLFITASKCEASLSLLLQCCLCPLY